MTLDEFHKLQIHYIKKVHQTELQKVHHKHSIEVENILKELQNTQMKLENTQKDLNTTKQKVTDAEICAQYQSRDHKAELQSLEKAKNQEIESLKARMQVKEFTQCCSLVR